MTSWFRNASIGVKASLAPVFAIACLLVVAGAGWLASRSMADDLRDVGGSSLARVTSAGAFAQELTGIHQQLYQSLAWEAVGQRAEVIQAHDTKLMQRMAAFEKRLAEAQQGLDPASPAAEALPALAKGFTKYAKLARDTLDIKSAGVATAAGYVTTMDSQYKDSLDRLGAFVAAESAAATALVAGAEARAARNLAVTLAATLLALGASAALTWYVVRAISNPLGHAAELAGSLAGGDLTQRAGIASADATGRVLQALDEVSRNIGQLVVDIRRTAEEVGTASSEIAGGNNDLSARTEATASALQQTAASMEELAQTLNASAENARQADAQAREAARIAREGGAVVADVVVSMEAINGQARRIADIITTIDGIAFQTNILALNAAVEAARAGEQGRGFAVVAGEVRGLAQSSASAAREIRGLIGASVEQIDAGTGKVRAAGEAMQRIVGAVEDVAKSVDDIARATAEQASGIAQVNDSVSEMDRSTQQNAAMVEQASAATESLRQQSQHLVALLDRFRTTA